jgi:hypothetical protein
MQNAFSAFFSSIHNSLKTGVSEKEMQAVKGDTETRKPLVSRFRASQPLPLSATIFHKRIQLSRDFQTEPATHKFSAAALVAMVTANASNAAASAAFASI